MNGGRTRSRLLRNGASTRSRREEITTGLVENPSIDMAVESAFLGEAEQPARDERSFVKSCLSSVNNNSNQRVARVREDGSRNGCDSIKECWEKKGEEEEDS